MNGSHLSKNNCLVFMPMYAGFETIRACVASAVESAGLQMHRLESEVSDTNWHVWLLDSIANANLVLADVTDHNPFVMYELGLAHQSRIPSIAIIRNEENKIPATLNGSPYLTYGEDCNELLPRLSSSLKDANNQKHRGSEARVSYEDALRVAVSFERAFGGAIEFVDSDEYNARVSVSVRRGCHPHGKVCDSRAGVRFLVATVVRESGDVGVMAAINDWAESY